MPRRRDRATASTDTPSRTSARCAPISPTSRSSITAANWACARSLRRHCAAVNVTSCRNCGSSAPSVSLERAQPQHRERAPLRFGESGDPRCTHADADRSSRERSSGSNGPVRQVLIECADSDRFSHGSVVADVGRSVHERCALDGTRITGNRYSASACDASHRTPREATRRSPCRSRTGAEPDVEGLWQYLDEPAEFFGLSMPVRSDLREAVTGFLQSVSAAAPDSVVATAVTLLDVDGQTRVVVTGERITPVRADAVRIAGTDAPLPASRPNDPHWRRMAARTTSRAEADQIRRWLAGRGYADAIEIRTASRGADPRCADLRHAGGAAGSRQPGTRIRSRSDVGLRADRTRWQAARVPRRRHPRMVDLTGASRHIPWRASTEPTTRWTPRPSHRSRGSDDRALQARTTTGPSPSTATTWSTADSPRTTRCAAPIPSKT